MNALQLWEAWEAQFNAEDEAVATAIWMANRFVKDKALSTRRKFYSIKDDFIRLNQRNLVDGRKVRDEPMVCARCEGEGTVVRGGRVMKCRRCNGTGTYTPTLFVHNFNLGDQRYSFHSYVQPARLSTKLGEDKEEYGGHFTEEELKEIALPMTGLLRILELYSCC